MLNGCAKKNFPEIRDLMNKMDSHQNKYVKEIIFYSK